MDLSQVSNFRKQVGEKQACLHAAASEIWPLSNPTTTPGSSCYGYSSQASTIEISTCLETC
jgi:hypothetical protein